MFEFVLYLEKLIGYVLFARACGLCVCVCACARACVRAYMRACGVRVLCV
jgi:hypothetical protein